MRCLFQTCRPVYRALVRMTRTASFDHARPDRLRLPTHEFPARSTTDPIRLWPRRRDGVSGVGLGEVGGEDVVAEVGARAAQHRVRVVAVVGRVVVLDKQVAPWIR